MTYLEIILEARELIVSKRERFLCYAIGNVSYHNLLETKGVDVQPLIHLVEELIAPYDSYDMWYMHHSGQTLCNYRQLRLDWIDNTIIPLVKEMDLRRIQPAPITLRKLVL